ncbi:MAG: hypothetical protein ABR547_09955 [Halanaerobium sp.]
MKVFNFLKRNKDQKIKFIKEHNLEDWWNQNFSDKEKRKIISESSNLLNNSNSEKTAARTLYLLAGNVVTRFHNNNPDAIIRILKKAAELSKDPAKLFEIYSQLIKLLVEQERKEEARNLIKQVQAEKRAGNWEKLLSQIN